jgi:microcystin-dependent protein
MKTNLKKTALSLASATALLGSAAWSVPSYACSDQSFISSICVMAAANLRDFSNQFAVADGRLLPVSQNTALFSLIGTTYGGTGMTSFNLPDLRGRIVVGAGPAPSGLPSYSIGEKGGAASITLTVAQLPAHVHALTATGAVTMGTLAATTTLSGLSASLTGNLTLKASSGGTLDNNPSGKSLATTIVSQGKIYSDAAPTVAMNAGSIDSSALKVGNFTGTPTTTLSGNPALSGNTAPAGSGLPVQIMPPYLAMTYYIAVTGLFPTNN